MRCLADLQAAIQSAVLNGQNVLDELQSPPDNRKDKAIGVYQSAYPLRLIEFLTNDYPKLMEYLGESTFRKFARQYASTHPSHHRNARWYGTGFPDFLQSHTELACHPEVHELAILERTLADAFDAADAHSMTLAELAAQDPELIGNAQIILHPSVRRLSITQNTTSIWSALACQEAPPKPYQLQEDAEIVAWRQSETSRFRILGKQEAMAMDCAKQSATFSVICELLAFNSDIETASLSAATFLRSWIDTRIISELRMQ